MTALAANKVRLSRNVHLASRGCETVTTAAVAYQGSLLNQVESTEKVEPASNTAGETFVGVHHPKHGKKVTGDGTKKAEYRFGHEELLTCSSLVSASLIGCDLAVGDDNTVTTVAGAGTTAVQIKVGMMTELVTSTSCYVWIRHFSGKTAP